MDTTMKTTELIGSALDWAVAKAAGMAADIQMFGPAQPTLKGPRIWIGRKRPFDPSTSWSDAGPIIEREGISIIRCDDDWGVDAKGFTTNQRIPVWCATDGQHSWDESTEHQQHDPMYKIWTSDVIYGPTACIAAMRCYVASKLGAEVALPDQLLETPLG
jgi:hypothetical protein